MYCIFKRKQTSMTNEENLADHCTELVLFRGITKKIKSAFSH